ncbi:MAG: CehA/McbA family metallohydrolase [Vicinamibacterales bacterium]
MRQPDTRCRRAVVAAALVAVALSVPAASGRQATAIAPGTRVALDAHNAYPYNGRFEDRIDRALAGGVPVAIEQDLVWQPGEDGRPGRSVISHGAPFDGTEPTLDQYFFERIRPIVERALRDGDSSDWPLVTLNLDLKSNEPEHHRALWDLLGRYESWLTTAVRTADGTRPAPLDVKPVLVLTGEADEQERSFHDQVPVGARLRLFGAVHVSPTVGAGETREAATERFWTSLPATPFPRATNYRRWWNANWGVVEAGGQRQAGQWTSEDAARLGALVKGAHDAGLWVRMWTLNGSDEATREANDWSAGYNFGSIEAAELRWRAAIEAGVDYVATDLYESFSRVLHAMRPRAGTPAEIVIDGTLTPADRLKWIERPFVVPPGTARIDVETSYTDRDAGTAIEFGLIDPAGFIGASRTSKSRFFVAEDAATPSYRPGPIRPGQWRLLMGVPSIRDGTTSRYRVTVRLTPEGADVPSPLGGVAPERGGAGDAASPRWYQGDFHAHTMHSDGFGCLDASGTAGPCSVAEVADAGARRGLDFLAITDHNTISHYEGMAEAQLRHPRMLLIRGQEVTTFYGHANVYGAGEVVDFRIGDGGRTMDDLLDQVGALGALISVNHPGRETGERCTGCGWSAPDTDWTRVDAIEAVNGSVLDGPTAGQPFWAARLNEGARITGIGGGDDHAASTGSRSAVGTPTTVVYAEALTETAILAGVRSGRVFIKTRGPDGPDLRFSAPALGAVMGEVVSCGSGTVRFRVSATRASGQRVDVIRNGQPALATAPVLDGDDAMVAFDLAVRPGDWVRVNLRDADGITVVGNPIYLR